MGLLSSPRLKSLNKQVRGSIYVELPLIKWTDEKEKLIPRSTQGEFNAEAANANDNKAEFKREAVAW